jgi:TolB-like protein/Flp pilus assembly protein TadD
MKRCPHCRRDYFDDTLHYCLDDGAPLLVGPRVSGDISPESNSQIPPIDEAEPATAILPPSSGRPESMPTGEDQKKRWLYQPRILLGIVGIAVLLFVGGYAAYRYTTTAAGEIDSIAVLPFENASGDPELDYLSDGISESVIDGLSQVPKLKVIARSSSFRYRGKDVDPRTVADILGVAAIVTGRVMPRGESVTIRVELIDARTNIHLWGDNFVKPLADVQVLQVDIARQIAEILRSKLSIVEAPQIAGAGTSSHEAYELFLRGRFYLHKAGMPENFRRAAEYLERAIAADPNYALAHAVLADAYGFGGFPPGLSRDDREVILARTVTRALDLDPDLPEAHSAMASYKRRMWQWDEAQRYVLRAVELNSNLAQAHNGYAFQLMVMGRFDEALERVRRARELDPVSLVINTNLGVVYLNMGRLDEAIDTLRKTIEFGEPAMFARRSLGSAYMVRGMYPEALSEYKEALQISRNAPTIEALIGTAHARAGNRVAAEDVLTRLSDIGSNSVPPELALLLDSLGRRYEAFAVLDQCLRNKVPGLPLSLSEPTFDPLRSDERFDRILGLMGLPLRSRSAKDQFYVSPLALQNRKKY